MRRLSLDSSGAVQALEKAVRTEPSRLDCTVTDSGSYTSKMAKTVKALDHLKIALLGDPSDVATLYSFGIAHCARREN